MFIAKTCENTVKPFNLAALNFSVLPFVDILAAL